MAEAELGRGTDQSAPRRSRAEAGRHRSATFILDQASEFVQPLLVPAKVIARVAGIAESSWWKLSSLGRTPAPIRLGRSTRWNLEECRRWLAAGAPSRERWEAMQERRP
jgi:predicted DNA-binding transcriptional regulator AlpA